MAEEKEFFTYRKDMLQLISHALNLVSRDLEKHHERVAYLAYHLADKLDMSFQEMEDVTMAALYHDLGAIGHDELPSVAQIEKEAGEQSDLTAGMLSVMPGMKAVSDIIRIVPYSWEYLVVCELEEIDMLKAQIVHVAVEISTNCANEDEPILPQVRKALEKVKAQRGKEYAEDVVDKLLEIQEAEDVWFRFAYDPGYIFYELVGNETLNLDQTLDMAHLIAMIVDFRNPFTVMHSAGVEASAVYLAEAMGLDYIGRKKMSIAGALHDIGKLRVPSKILEKPGKLTTEEYDLVKEHAFFTYTLLSQIRGFDDIAQWASFHHEKLNGTGYPFHLTKVELNLECRIMMVADVFSALAEDRPYRKGFDKDKILDIIDDMVDKQELCGKVAEALEMNYEGINAYREEQARKVGSRYYRKKQ